MKDLWVLEKLFGLSGIFETPPLDMLYNFALNLKGFCALIAQTGSLGAGIPKAVKCAGFERVSLGVKRKNI